MVCLPALFAGLVGGATLATTALYGVPAGLAVGASSLLLVHIRPRTWRVFRDGPEQPRFLLTAVMVGCGVVAGFLAILAGTGLVALLPAWVGLALSAAAIGASYGFELIVSHGSPRRALLLGVRLTVVTVATWLVMDNADEPRVFVAGLVAGLIVAQGIRLVKAMPMDHLVYPHSSDEPPDWRLGRMDYWVLAGSAVAIVAAFALGASLGSPEAEAVLGILTGAVAAKAWRRRPPFFAGPLSRLLHGLLLRWTGYLPWRRRAFLRYAADRYVLSRTGPGEYAFIHLLVRDHLAECDPDALAAKVDHRITERQARDQTRAASPSNL